MKRKTHASTTIFSKYTETNSESNTRLTDMTNLNRYIWLVDLLNHTGGLTREEIERYWLRSRYNTDKSIKLPERTFFRHIAAIKELFGINIVCNRGAGYLYRIENSDDMDSEGVRHWLLNTLAVNNLVNESQNLKHRILFENIPSGQKFLTPLIEAMRDNVTVMLTYQSFNSETARTFEIEPLCVKVFKQRWYLLGKSKTYDSARVNSLDRVQAAEPSKHKFKLPTNFDAESYFREGIGIIIGYKKREKQQKVEVRVDGTQRNYFRSLPLHHTQEETQKNDDNSIFTFFVRPTIDFIQELLKYGAAIEVISPQWLREEMGYIARDMMRIYDESTTDASTDPD